MVMPGSSRARHLIADGLARTCGHHGQHILPGQQAGDDLLLPRAEAVVAKDFFSEYYADFPWFLLSIQNRSVIASQCHLS